VIVSGGARSNWRFFAKHLTNAHDNETVRFIEFRGVAAETPLEALREMDAFASTTRCENHLYHANINPQAHETLSPEQWERAVDILEKELGLEGHSRFIVEHEKEGRTHRHVMWSRIHHETKKAAPVWKNFEKHEAAARTMEKEFDLGQVGNSLGPDRVKRERRERRPKNWEQFRGKKSGVSPQEVKAEITGLWKESATGKEFAAALQEKDYVLCKGDRRDFCVVDGAGHEHSLARRIEGVKAAEIREKMQGIDREALPTVAEGRDLARQKAKEKQEEKRTEDLASSRAPEKKKDKTPEKQPKQRACRPMRPMRPMRPTIVREHETALGLAVRLMGGLYKAFGEFYAIGQEAARDFATRIMR
jgi:Relaxase/Mobilisation nuclease domain